MSTSRIELDYKSQISPVSFLPDEPRWYAIQTVARHEKRVAGQLVEKRMRTFLPIIRQIRQWCDRQSTVEMPMFSCYAFVRMVHTVEERLKVLRTPGVLGFVGSERHGTPIPDEQIENLQKALEEKIPCAVHPFIQIGQRVRIRGGSLMGMEGILMGHGGDQSLIISVELLRRSLAVRIAGYEIESV